MHALTKIGSVLLLAGLLIGMTALAVRHGDRGLMVPPPDAVAEGFVREVVMKRYTRAEEYLRDEVPEERLATLERNMHANVGDPGIYDAKIVRRDDRSASASVRLASGDRSQTLTFALVFDDEWKIILD